MTHSFVYLPWPSTIEQPVLAPTAQYEDIRVRGLDVTQPRRTVCYGQSYKYSGRQHKLESETPSDIESLMSFTRTMYDEKEAVTMMCLANMYRTGNQCIDEHSDKEGQMSSIRDVVCWLVGAPRRLIIRSRKLTDIRSYSASASLPASTL